MSGTLTRVLDIASTLSRLASGPVVQLDNFGFTEFEVPERMRWGGEQAGTIHRLIGDGKRVLDKTGPNEAPIEWSGTLLGPNAKDRARDLDALRQDGGPFDLDWVGSSQRVLVKSCLFDEGYSRISYRIVCEIIPPDDDDDSQDYGPASATKDGFRLDGALSSVSNAISDFQASPVGQAVSQGLQVAAAVGVPGAGLIGTALNGGAQAALGAAAGVVGGLRDATSSVLTVTNAISTLPSAGFGAVVTAAQTAATLTGGLNSLARAGALLRG